MQVRSLEAIECGGGSHSIGTHVLKNQPVTHLQVRQATLLSNAIKAITCWTPDTAGVHDFIWLWLLLGGDRGQQLLFVFPFTDTFVGHIELHIPYAVLANSEHGHRVYS